MLKKLLEELQRITAVLTQILERLDRLAELPKAAAPDRIGAKDPEEWMAEGLANILGYQPGRKEGEE